MQQTHYQKMMVDFAHPVHHQIDVNPSDVIETLIPHMAYMDEPTGDGAAIPSFLLAKEAKKYVRVLLSGEGGDEVFNAYETHGAFKARKLYRACVPAFLRKGVAALAQALPVSFSKLSFDFLCKRFTAGAEMGTAEAHLYWRHVLSEAQKKGMMPRLNGYEATETLFRRLFDSLDFADELNRISLIDIKYYFIGDLMVKNDRTIMAHSIEARFPYMDKIVMDFVSRIPPNLRIKGLSRRYIQKRAMRGRLPEAILKRGNMGLEMPHSLWFMEGFRKELEPYFTKERVGRYEIFDAEFVSGLWRQHCERRCDNGRALWCILNYMVWFDLFVASTDFKKYLK